MHVSNEGICTVRGLSFFVAYLNEVIGYVTVEAVFFPMQGILMSDHCFLGHRWMCFHSQGMDVVV